MSDEDAAVREVGGDLVRGARRARQWLGAIMVTLVFAFVLAHETSFADIVARLRAMPAEALLWALTWLAIAGAARALRLQLLLPRRVSFADAYAFNQIYNVVTATVPTGLGEAASAWLMRRALHVPLHLGLVTLLVGRFLDLLVLVCLFLAVVLGGAARIEAGGSVVAVASGLCAALVALASLHLASRERIATALHTWAAAEADESAPWPMLRRSATLLAEAVGLLPTGRRAALVAVLTLATQLLSLLALHALLRGAQLDLGYASAVVCFGVYVLLRMLPLQGIAGIGTTAAWWAIALSTLDVASGEATLVGSVLYVAFFTLLLVLCLTCLPLLAFPRRNP